jgi:hypothetical protein
MLVPAYYMLKNDEPYRDLGPDWLARRNDEAHTRRLVAHLDRLGHPVVLDQPAACPNWRGTGGRASPALR